MKRNELQGKGLLDGSELGEDEDPMVGPEVGVEDATTLGAKEIDGLNEGFALDSIDIDGHVKVQ